MKWALVDMILIVISHEVLHRKKKDYKGKKSYALVLYCFYSVV
jgi:hypothetical protein